MPSQQEQPAEVEDTLETGGNPRHEERRRAPKELLRQKAERFEFSLLASEDDEWDGNEEKTQSGRSPRSYIVRRRQSLKPEHHQNLWKRAKSHLKSNMRNKDDPHFDLPEDHKVVLEAEGIKQVRVPSLVECRGFLSNPEADEYRHRAFNPLHMISNLILNVFAAFIIWFVNMLTVETCLVVCNAAGAAAYFSDTEERREQW